MKHICIIEDDPWLGQLLELSLQQVFSSADINRFAKLQPALNHLRGQPLDLLISDLKLPDGSGLDALQLAAQRRPHSHRILVTAHIERHSVQAARRAGATDFIAKPFTIDNLLNRLQRLGASPGQAPVATDLADLDHFLGQRLQQTLYLPWTHQAQHTLISQLPDDAPAREMVRLARLEPMLCAELIATANQLNPDDKGYDCLSVEAALRQLGPDNSQRLLRQLLSTRPVLTEPVLVGLASNLTEQQSQLAKSLIRLAGNLQADPGVVRAAISLCRIGELSVLCAMQNYINYGQHPDAAELPVLLHKYASEFGNQLKIRLKLPFPLRQLIGALFVLPKTQVHKDQIIMRIAALETGLSDSPNELTQLKRQIKLA
ncbi:response regulator [Halopseudomonas salegens]|uniref:Response regulator receiver domain-containing protein n=1 Tax=Halopseudomonas salegens TaxID=1434072 RepID=A0A1H2HM50_9GAMM|nr:response regulator [Halopseudomonas salegens]SDU32915.1 Response regulator receiver domain-containing protein [Halopseudomonas salegens]